MIRQNVLAKAYSAVLSNICCKTLTVAVALLKTVFVEKLKKKLNWSKMSWQIDYHSIQTAMFLLQDHLKFHNIKEFSILIKRNLAVVLKEKIKATK